MILKYFKLSEFNCPFLQDQKMNFTFLEKLDYARGLAEIPFKITSGYRTKEFKSS